MAYTYPQITISSTAHNVYVTLAGAEEYLAAALHATAWAAAVTATRNVAIVTATRMLDRQRWAGDKTDAANALAWPRSGVTDADGEDVDEVDPPQAVIDACCELAAILLEDASSQSANNAGSNIKRIGGAGVPTVEWFGPRTAGRFPRIAQELVGAFLASTAGIAALAPRVSGTSAESVFEACDASDNYDLSGGQ